MERKFKRGDFISGIDRSYERSIYEVLGYSVPDDRYVLNCIYYAGHYLTETYKLPKKMVEAEYNKIDPVNKLSLKVLYGRGNAAY